MVLSRINRNVEYNEIKQVNPQDVDKDRNIYKTQIYGVEVVIIVGAIINTYEKYDIVYSPIYLVKSNKRSFQVGVYEVNIKASPKYADDENELMVDKLNVAPLFYKYVSKELCLNVRIDPAQVLDKNTPPNVLPSEPPAEYTIPDERKDIFLITKGVPLPPLLETETKEDAKQLTKQYAESSTDNWMQKFMKNKNYAMVDNEGGGDCFFAVVRDAFSSIAQQTTVQKLRKKLSNEVTQELYNSYKAQYDAFVSSIENDSKVILEINREYTRLKQAYNSIIDRTERQEMVFKLKQMKEQHDRLKKERNVSNQMLNEYKYLEGVKTLEGFRKKITTCEFWAETWAISTIERILSIKLIILSEESYNAGDLRNVLMCGQLNDVILESSGVFVPEYYIMAQYNGYHYQLISYKKKMIFKFNEIPYEIKNMIITECVKNNAGPFAIIPDVQEFKRQESAVAEPTEPVMDELSESKLRGLYDDNIVFSFYAKSADKPLPGKGNGEQIPKELVKEFSGLASIPQWRKKLSNSWVQPFKLDNYSWASVDHYYNAEKFKNTDRDFYISFTIESGTELSKNSEMAKAAGSKSGKLNKDLIRPKGVVVDKELNPTLKNKALYNAQYAKFTQNEDLRQLLILTKNSKLVLSKETTAAEVFDSLMIIRDKLQKS